MVQHYLLPPSNLKTLHWQTGRIDLRAAMAIAARHAVKCSPHLKAIVAVARKLLVAVWQVLTYGCADRFADGQQVAASFFAHA